MKNKDKFEELTSEVYQVLNEMVRQQDEFDRFGSKLCELPEYDETVRWLKEKMDEFANENGIEFEKVSSDTKTI